MFLEVICSHVTGFSTDGMLNPKYISLKWLQFEVYYKFITGSFTFSPGYLKSIYYDRAHP